MIKVNPGVNLYKERRFSSQVKLYLRLISRQDITLYLHHELRHTITYLQIISLFSKKSLS